jgi:hypothetical protein
MSVNQKRFHGENYNKHDVNNLKQKHLNEDYFQNIKNDNIAQKRIMVFEIIKCEEFIGRGFYIESLKYINPESDNHDNQNFRYKL